MGDERYERDALAALRSARRRNRIARLDWFDAFYKAYVGAIFGAIAVYVIAGTFGDKTITGHQMLTVQQNGQYLMGIVVAAVVAVGLRSGGRGGPLAFERAEVRHVLLAPVDRRLTMRGPALRQARHGVFIAAVLGAVAGLMAVRRFPGLPAAWVLWSAVFVAAAVTVGYGAAMIASGLRSPRWLAEMLALVLLVWATSDWHFHVDSSPTSWLGEVALFPLRTRLFGIAGLGVAVAIGALGLSLASRCSMESSERRSRLIGQLRFAATLQDVRTVLVLQRQLAQEQLRQRPYIRLPNLASSRHWPTKNQLTKGQSTKDLSLLRFMRRSLQGMLRWPLFRILRLPVLSLTAGLCAYGAWSGTAPLIVPAGLIFWVIALDLLEGLAQETDHPDRLRSFPVVSGRVQVRHLVIPAMVLVVLVALASVPGLVLERGLAFGEIYGLIGISTVLSALGGAALVLVREMPAASGQIEMPEMAGAKLLWRVAMPPALAVVSMAVLIPARRTYDQHHLASAMINGVSRWWYGSLVLGSWAVVWVRYGQELYESLTRMGAEAVRGPETVKK